MPGRRRRLLRAIEWLLASIGVVCLAWYGVVMYRAIEYQRHESAKLDRAMETASSESQDRSKADQPPIENPTIERSEPPSHDKPDHELIGRLEVPRLKLSVMVVDGDDAATLKIAAGHLPDTPLPWEFGNSAVAGHRDSFFRPLSDIKLNDGLILMTQHGEFHYAVSSLRVVAPNDLTVLRQDGRSSLTLVTCYPFSYVGRAPKRFVVRAEHVPG
jgi:LPXTG-site transpeptidase (sortase) family protein